MPKDMTDERQTISILEVIVPLFIFTSVGGAIWIDLPKSIEKKPERNSISSTKPKNKNNPNQQKSITSEATIELTKPTESLELLTARSDSSVKASSKILHLSFARQLSIAKPTSTGKK